MPPLFLPEPKTQEYARFDKELRLREQKLTEFVDAERRMHPVYPPENEVFNAFKLTPYDAVKVLLLGQDPYHDEGQAHGLCFSVRPGVRRPPQGQLAQE